MASNSQTTPADDDTAAAHWVDVATLREWAQNPRKNDKAVAEVAKSIRRFGWGAPIVANKRDGEIIAGHTRYQAALRLKLTKVPVRWVDLDPADAHALALADNRIGEVATWDDDRLRDVLRDLRAADDSLLADLGFSDSELRGLLGDVERNLPNPDDVVNDQRWTILLTFPNEAALQDAFAVCKGHAWACKIIE